MHSFLQWVRTEHVFVTSMLLFVTMASWSITSFCLRVRFYRCAILAMILSIGATVAVIVVAYPAMVEQDAVYLGAAVLLLSVIGGICYGLAPDRRKIRSTPGLRDGAS